MTLSTAQRSRAWPSLPLSAWSDTYATLHLWLQIVGKIRLVQSPWINHGWHVTLYVTGRGLSTSPIPQGARTFQIELDFVAHEAVILTSNGGSARVPLRPQSVAEFYRRLMAGMAGLGLAVRIHATPNEVPDPVVAFDQDEAARAYDAEYANRYWRVLVQADRVFKTFRARFIGKCSPVHFFWGAPDLAVTLSGRSAPQHPGGVPNLPDWVTREAYSHELSSCGFWAGGEPVPYPVFYSYAYPEPRGFADAKVRPEAAFFSSELREFLLPYDAVRESESSDETLLEFLQTTYEAAATIAGWDRDSLERPAGWKAGA